MSGYLYIQTLESKLSEAEKQRDELVMHLTTNMNTIVMLLDALDIDPEETRVNVKSGEKIVKSISIAELLLQTNAIIAKAKGEE